MEQGLRMSLNQFLKVFEGLRIGQIEQMEFIIWIHLYLEVPHMVRQDLTVIHVMKGPP